MSKSERFLQLKQMTYARNDLSLDDSPETMVKQLIETAQCLKTRTNNVLVSNILARGDKYKGKD